MTLGWADAPSGRRLLVVRCSAAKCPTPEPIPALDRYDGPVFRVIRRAARAGRLSPSAVWIVSARFGVVAGDTPIPWYDEPISPASRARALQRLPHQIDRLAADPSITDALFVASRAYRPLFEAIQRALPAAAITWLSGNRGAQLTKLHTWLHDDILHKTFSADDPDDHVMRHSAPPTVAWMERLQTLLAKGLPTAATPHGWAVVVGDARVSPKWLVSQVLGVPARQFHTHAALRHVRAWGLRVEAAP